MTRIFRPSAVCLAAGVLASFMLAAPAASAADISRTDDGIAIRYSPAELTNAGDAENLYRKLRSASRKVCGLEGRYQGVAEQLRAERCYQEVLASVVRKINQPMLTSLHAAKTNKVG